MPKGIRSTRYHLASLPGVLFNAEGDAGGGGGEGAPAAGTPATGDESQLGDAGKQALDRMKAERNAAKSEKQAETERANALQAELDKIRQAGETDQQKAQREAEKALKHARDEAAAQARAEVTRDRVIDKIEVAAAGKFTDPEDARLHLEKRLDEFIKDGAPDTAAIAAAVEKLLTDKPHLAASTKTPVPSPGRVGIGTGSSSASDAVQPGLGRLQHAYAQSPHNK